MPWPCGPGPAVLAPRGGAHGAGGLGYAAGPRRDTACPMPDASRPAPSDPGPPAPPAGTPGEVLRVFTRLGLTSFGGPVAHLGYFHRELVQRRRWLDEAQYAQLLALCQFLPGPASSQLGFALGLLRAGWAGALAAFVAFTLPSVLLLLAFALLLPQLQGDMGTAALQGLKILALAVVAHGLYGMARKLCPDPPRIAIAALTAAPLLAGGGALLQLTLVAAAALAGLWLCRGLALPAQAPLRLPHGPRLGLGLLGAFFALLLVLPLVPGAAAATLAAVYRAGALVFGGGHVVLPLLEESMVGPAGLSAETFLAGYGAAQAVPGPLFSIAAYLGALHPALGGVGGALPATLAIFLPGFLLLAAALPLWGRLAQRPVAAGAVAGVNAAVVGLLGAALYDPVFVEAVGRGGDLALAVLAYAALASGRVPVLLVVAGCVLGRVLLAL